VIGRGLKRFRRSDLARQVVVTKGELSEVDSRRDSQYCCRRLRIASELRTWGMGSACNKAAAKVIVNIPQETASVCCAQAYVIVSDMKQSGTGIEAALEAHLRGMCNITTLQVSVNASHPALDICEHRL